MKTLLKVCGGLWISAAMMFPCYADEAPPPAAAPRISPLMAAFGGPEQLQAMTNEFVDLLFVDPRIKDKFANASAQKLKILLDLQFCQLIDNSCQYPGRDMKSAHAGRNIDNADFNALAEDLQIVLAKHGVPFSAQNKLLAKLAPMERDVVTK